MRTHCSRRDFLSQAVLGTVATGAGLAVPSVRAAAALAPRFHVPRIRRNPDRNSRVAIVKGSDRKQNMLEALDLIKDGIQAGIGDKQVVIKVNFTSSLLDAGTHVDVVRAICETITPFYDREILVTEGQGNKPIEADWLTFGYLPLTDEFNVRLVDEWDEQFSPLTILDVHGLPITVPVCERWRDANTYLISAAVLKVHHSAVVTLSLKNVLMASIWNYADRNYRKLMHIGPYWDAWDYPQLFHLNQFLIGQHTAPDLAVIDGFQGMEEWELRGPLVDSRVAIASTDFLAADRIGTDLMMEDFANVGYLNHCAAMDMGNANPGRIDVLGHSVAECRMRFKQIDRTREKMYHWRS